MPKLSGLPRVSIPGPRPLPGVGATLNVLRFFSDPVGRLLDLSRRFGPLAAVNDGDPGLVLAFGAEHNRAVLASAALFQNMEEFLFEAPPGSSLERFNRSLVLMNGDRHRRARRLMMPAFQRSALDGYVSAIVSTTDAMLGRWTINQTHDIAVRARELTLVMAMRCFFGVDAEDRAEDLGRVAVAQLEALASLFTIVAPFDLPGTSFRRLMRVCEDLEARFRALIAEARARPPGRDALSLVVHARDEDGSALGDDELIGLANTLFVAGHETTANTIGWTLFLLGQHPDVLAAVVAEVEATLRGGPPDASHVARMPLVDRVVKESMRIIPVTPMLFVRVGAAESTVGGVRLPKGANVILSPLVTHRDPDLFPAPRRFSPERWEKLDPSPYAYLPFGAGPRMCLGASFAELALRLILPMILQRYRLTLAPNARVSRAVRGITLDPKHGLPMLVAPQDHHFVRRGPVRGDVHDLVDL